MGGQRQQRGSTALTMIVGAQHQHDVFEGHDDRQRPEENRQDAEDAGRVERNVTRGKHRFDRIQNAGADIAVNDTDGAQGERRK